METKSHMGPLALLPLMGSILSSALSPSHHARSSSYHRSETARPCKARRVKRVKRLAAKQARKRNRK